MRFDPGPVRADRPFVGNRIALGLALVGVLAASPPVHALPQATFVAAPTKTNVTRKVRDFIQNYNRKAAMRALPADANQYRYVLGKGLFGNIYPFYMSRNAKALRRAGLQVEFAKISTVGRERENVDLVKQMIRTTPKPMVIETHSQGTAIFSQAIGELNKTDPEIVRKNVRAFISLEGAYGGSSVADLLMSSRIGRGIARGLTGLFGGRIDAIAELQTKVRTDINAEFPVPTATLPTVSMVGYQTHYRSILAPGLFLLKRFFGQRTDGLVAHQSAVIPGSDVVRLPISHAQAAWGRYSEMLSLGLVTHALSMPYEAP